LMGDLRPRGKLSTWKSDLSRSFREADAAGVGALAD